MIKVKSQKILWTYSIYFRDFRTPIQKHPRFHTLVQTCWLCVRSSGSHLVTGFSSYDVVGTSTTLLKWPFIPLCTLSVPAHFESFSSKVSSFDELSKCPSRNWLLPAWYCVRLHFWQMHLVLEEYNSLWQYCHMIYSPLGSTGMLRRRNSKKKFMKIILFLSILWDLLQVLFFHMIPWITTAVCYYFRAWITDYPCTTLTGDFDQCHDHLPIPKQGTKICNIMKCEKNSWLLSILFYWGCKGQA